MNMSYEFNDEQAERLWLFGNKLAYVGIATGMAGFFGFLATIIDFSLLDTLQVVTRFAEYSILMIAGVILFRPTDNFKKIAATEGRDIAELMRGLKEFTFAFRLMAGLLLLIAIFYIALIIGKVSA